MLPRPAKGQIQSPRTHEFMMAILDGRHPVESPARGAPEYHDVAVNQRDATLPLRTIVAAE